jgi:peptidoglycan/xylan/chitin deacetylase (PgdA/CDA1 family)
MAYAVRGRSATWLAPSVYRGSRREPRVALTFDDGPTPGTLRLLEILAKERTPAGFFLCGANVERHPRVAAAIAAAGHEIGNHSYSHPLFALKPARFIEAEVQRAQEVITQAAGVAPRWFRPPYGVRWFGLRRIQRQAGLVGVMWTVIGRDWKLDAESVARRVAARAGPGAILCLHDGRELAAAPDISATLEAVRMLIPLLRQRGLEFATLSSMICPKT